MSDLTVIVPTIPERTALFDEAVKSVTAQTVRPKLITKVDNDHRGVVPTVNELAQSVLTPWLHRLDDDDLLDPDHCEVLSHWLDDDADIVYSWCRIEGGGELHPEAQFQIRLQDEYGWGYLRYQNWIPCAAAIRTDLWIKLGGLRDVQEEDWDFWQRALDAGARFRCVPAVTWTYRMNSEWAHRSDFHGCAS